MRLETQYWRDWRRKRGGPGKGCGSIRCRSGRGSGGRISVQLFWARSSGRGGLPARPVRNGSEEIEDMGVDALKHERHLPDSEIVIKQAEDS